MAEKRTWAEPFKIKVVEQVRIRARPNGRRRFARPATTHFCSGRMTSISTCVTDSAEVSRSDQQVDIDVIRPEQKCVVAGSQIAFSPFAGLGILTCSTTLILKGSAHVRFSAISRHSCLTQFKFSPKHREPPVEGEYGFDAFVAKFKYFLPIR